MSENIEDIVRILDKNFEIFERYFEKLLTPRTLMWFYVRMNLTINTISLYLYLVVYYVTRHKEE